LNTPNAARNWRHFLPLIDKPQPAAVTGLDAPAGGGESPGECQVELLVKQQELLNDGFVHRFLITFL